MASAPTAGINGALASAFLSASILTCARPPAAHNASSVPVLHTALMRPGTRDRIPAIVALFSRAIRIDVFGRKRILVLVLFFLLPFCAAFAFARSAYRFIYYECRPNSALRPPRVPFLLRDFPLQFSTQYGYVTATVNTRRAFWWSSVPMTNTKSMSIEKLRGAPLFVFFKVQERGPVRGVDFRPSWPRWSYSIAQRLESPPLFSQAS